MRRHLPLLIAALFASALTFLVPARAEAGPAMSLATWATPLPTASAIATPVYYGGSHHSKSYEDHDDGDYGDYEDEYDGYKRKHRKHCGGGYHRKYVCEHTEKRCFKQRECVWYYGREYCRYIRKCVGGKKYCKWVNVPHGHNSCY